ncbi:MAG: hypothetical protein R3C11_18215 [Planctomycetaceae bacterium]
MEQRPDIPILTVSWINNRMKEMADEQSYNEFDGEVYQDYTGNFFSACWDYCSTRMSDFKELLFQSSRR